MKIEINVDDVCLDLFIVRKHKLITHMAYCRCENVHCTVHTGEDKKERKETTGRRMPSFVAAST